MRLKKLVVALLLVGFSTSLFPKQAKSIDTKETWESQYTNDTKKVWKVNFSKALSSSIDSSNIKNYIYLQDYNNNKISVNITISKDRKYVEVNYPYYGYEKNKNYYLVILPGLEADDGKKIPKEIKIPFIVNDFIVFKDKNLENAIKKAMNKTNTGILKEDAAKVETLNLSGNDIESLEGLNYFTNLKTLNINSNKVKDITPLKTLTNLEKLYLQNNSIEDITELKGLYKLNELNLRENNIKNIDSLKYLSSYYLKTLDLGSNKISQINSLSNFTGLTSLKLDNNYIEDINPIKSLSNLKTLHLDKNNIINYSPVMNYYDKLTDKDFALNYSVSITDATLNQIIRKKINKPTGDLYYRDLLNIRELDLSNTSIYSLAGIKNLTSLEKLNLSGIKASDFSELQYLKDLKELDISNTTNYSKYFIENLTKLEKLNMKNANVYDYDLSKLTKLDNLLELNLKDNINLSSIKNIQGYLKNLLYLNISGTGIKYQNSGEDVTLQEIINGFPNLKEVDTSNLKLDKEIILNGAVTFEDKNFENAIREILKKYSGDIYAKDVKHIEKLDLQNMKIINLKGIENFIGLKYLNLSNNEIINMEPISYLTNLETLILHNNNISITDNKSLSKLQNLTELDLSKNNISDISPLKGLVNLKRLDLSYNSVQKIYDLDSLKKLEYLSLYHNEVGHDRFVAGQPIPAADLSPLKYLFNLKELFLGQNDYIQNYPDDTYASIIPYYEKLQNKDFDIDVDKYEVKFGKDQGNSDDKSALEKKVRKILNKPNEEKITYGDVKNISSLNLESSSISNLDGIQYFTSLLSLDLSNNSISSTEPLRNLKKLKCLNLSNSNIDNEELKDLSGLVNLNELRLDGNTNITDITPLKNLTYLTTLYLPQFRSNEFYLPTSNYYHNLTNKNFTLNNISVITIDRIDDSFQNVNRGGSFTLPSIVTAKMTNGSTRQLEVIWDSYNVNTWTPGVYNYYGTVEGYNRKVKFTLNVMEDKISTRGNSIGNIMNKGLVASDGKNLYYSNPINGGKLYRESLESGIIEQLTSDEVSYINVYNGWVYFLSKGDMYRIKTDGTNLMRITSDNANYINLVDKYIYYFDATKGGIWRIDIDDIGYGEVPNDKIKPIKDRASNPVSWDVFTQIAVEGDYVYFQNLQDSLNLYKMKLDGSEACSKINTGEVRNINIYEDYLYFTEGNKIYKISKNGGDKTSITTKTANYINVSNGWIYFRNDSDSGKLYKVKTDGTYLVKLSDDKVRNINVIGNYVYYINESNSFTLSKTNTD